MFGVERAVGVIRREGTELYTFLYTVGVAFTAYRAGVVVVAPEAGGDGEDREEGSASENGVKSVVEGKGGGEGECEGSTSLTREGRGQMPEPEPRRRAASRFGSRTTMLAIAALIVVLVVGGVLIFWSTHVAMPAGASRDDRPISCATDPRSLISTSSWPVNVAFGVSQSPRASKAAPVGRES